MKWMRDMARWLLAPMLVMAGMTAHAADTTGNYLLGPGDQIRISVFQNPDLALETRISETNTISFPLLGTIKIGELSITDAEKKIADELKKGNFLKQPQVSILVIQFKAQSVSILGLVNRPGRYSLSPLESKLSQLLAQAGGVVAIQGADTVVVTGERNGKPFRREIDFPEIFSPTGSSQDMVLANGDSVWVDRAPMVFIYGEVLRGGPIRLERDMTVLQALASVGGLTQRGTTKGIKVHRRDGAGNVNIIEPGMNDKLQTNDVIYVKESLF